MSANPASQHRHDWHSTNYVERWIEGSWSFDEQRRELLATAVALLPEPVDAALRVLDVGGGYGVFTAEVLQARPASTVCLHDFSEPMLAAARQRLAPLADRVTYHRADLLQRDWFAGLDGPFDAVVSSLAIHNLAAPDVIRRVFADIAALLGPGGRFLNADLVLPPAGSVLGQFYDQARLRHPSPSPHDHDDHGPGHVPHGHGARSPLPSITPSITLEDQLRWLREAGFAEVDCPWKQFRQVLFCGIRGS